MAQIVLKPRTREEPSSRRTGGNIITWTDKNVSHSNQLTSIVNPAGKGYNLRLWDVTTDTFPPYQPNEGRQLEALKVVAISNMDVRSNDTVNHPNNAIVVGDIIKRSNLLNDDIAFGWGSSAGWEYTTRIGYVDFLFSDDGIRFTENTRKRFYFMYAPDVYMGNGLRFTIDFNELSTLNIYSLQERQFITPYDISSALSYNAYGGNLVTPSQEVQNFFDSMLSEDNPSKIHIKGISGTNCIKYFEELIVPEQKLSFEGLRQNKVWIDHTLMNENDLPKLDIYIGEAMSGVFRNKKLID